MLGRIDIRKDGSPCGCQRAARQGRREPAKLRSTESQPCETGLPSGDHSEAEPPGPIPNPEVKRRSADGSGTIGPVRVGRCQVYARFHREMEPGFFVSGRDGGRRRRGDHAAARPERRGAGDRWVNRLAPAQNSPKGSIRSSLRTRGRRRVGWIPGWRRATGRHRRRGSGRRVC